jgi:hypothetical protein
MNRALVFGFTAVLALAGCGGKKDEKPVEKTPPAGSATTMAGSGSAAIVASGSGSAGSAVDVPTEEDFEGQAKTDISTANVDSKVKAIEDQLGQQ